MATLLIKTTLKDVPKACAFCPLYANTTAYVNVHSLCLEWMKVDWRDICNKRADDCPILGILPETHGRLIDGDEADNRIGKNITDYYEQDGGGYYLAEDARDEVSMMLEHETLVPAEKG